MYAFVRFLEDDTCFALAVSSVEGFRPLHRGDFDNQKVYLVHRAAAAEEEEEDEEEEGGGGDGQPSRAQILALAAVLAKADAGMLNRASVQDHGRPTSTSSSKSLAAVVARLERNAASSCTEGEDYLEEDRLIEEEEDGYYDDEDTEGEHPHLHHHHQQQQQHQHHHHHQHHQEQGTSSSSYPETNTQRTSSKTRETDCGSEEESAAAVAAAVAAAGTVPRVLYEELVHSYRQQEEEMRRPAAGAGPHAAAAGAAGQEAQGVRQPADRGIGYCGPELVSKESGAAPFQEPMHDNGTQTIKAEAVEPLVVEAQEAVSREEANTSSSHSPSPRAVYTCSDGKVHLGGGIWVEEEKWHQLQRTQGDSKFTKNLAVMIWGTETLKNRSVTGVATKKKKDALPKPPLSPSKLKIVRECLYDRVSQETADSAEITQRLSKVNKYICEKIMDINKSIKNEERRESKLLIRQTVKMENFSYDGM
ncbi:hypothetical protein CRUP_007166 [Coryphaenoides rupestris]|nr:hypothetical protein CRUP_007166 [Coryphaenoides rupestris]